MCVFPKPKSPTIVTPAGAAPPPEAPPTEGAIGQARKTEEIAAKAGKRSITRVNRNTGINPTGGGTGGIRM
jgi:hypothetical protein